MSVYNSFDAGCKTPFGAVPAGTTVVFRLRVPCAWGQAAPRLYIGPAGKAAQEYLFSHERRDEAAGEDLFVLSYQTGAPAAYFYWFDLWTGYTKVFCGSLGEGVCTTGEGVPYQLTVYDGAFATPAQLAGGVMYQIFPDRFAEGHKNKSMPFADRIYRTDKDGEPYFWATEQQDGHLNLDYFGGDFLGIEQKLPYLNELGVTCIYLNPIFEAHSNHRYNTADYLRPDPLLGTEEEFVHLCQSARALGIVIVLDGVFSHTGSDSVYFDKEGRYGSNGAYHNPSSPYRCWYDFDPAYPSGYRCWWGFETLPEVLENEPSYRQFICGEGGVIDHWLQLGAGGFRLDVADELPDDFIADIRRAVKRSGDDKLLLGEVWEDATNKESYGAYRAYLLGQGLDSVMNYPFRTAILSFGRSGNAAALREAVSSIIENYPPPALRCAMNFLSTHDTVRAITALAGDDVAGHDRYWQSGRTLSAGSFAWGKKMLHLCFAILFTLPGIPCVYYGDEIAMQGYKDPFNRAFYDWSSREEDLRRAIRALSALRQSCDMFAAGALTFLEAEGNVLFYTRTSATGRAFVLINRGNVPICRSVGNITLSADPIDYSIRLCDQSDNFYDV